MGCVLSSKSSGEKKQLRARIYLLEEEIRLLKHKTEQENKGHEQCTAMLISKEAEWKKERKKFEYECGMLRKKLDEEEVEGRRKLMEENHSSNGGKVESDGWFLVEQMRAEQVRREEAMDKWKQLYLSIKTELDDLIQRTGQGVSLWCGREEEEEEDMINALQRELKARDEILEETRRRLSMMEREGAKREREIDILRQSLRILNGNNNNKNKVSRRRYKEGRLQREKGTRSKQGVSDEVSSSSSLLVRYSNKDFEFTTKEVVVKRNV